MKKNIYSLLATVLLLASTFLNANALTVDPNSQLLFSDQLDPSEIAETIDMNHLGISIRYQVEEGGIFACTHAYPSECHAIGPTTSNVYERLRGSATLYVLKNGKKILSVAATSRNPNLGEIRLEQEYEGVLYSKEKRAKIVSSGPDFIYGRNLNTDFMDFRQRSHYNGYQESSTIGSLRLYMSAPANQVFTSFRFAKNIKVAVMTYNIL